MLGALAYAGATSVATILGGLLPLHPRLREIELRYLVAFASGFLVSIAFFNMIPAMEPERAIPLALGFFSIYFIEKLVMIHACGERECEGHTVGWVAMIGVAVESLIDGLAIGTGYAVAPPLGALIALAIIVHELPRGFTTTVIMRQSKYGARAIAAALAIDAGFTPLGALASGLFPAGLMKPLMGFTAGAFLYVGASDLLPEAHRRFNLQVVLLVLAGAGLVPLLDFVLGGL
ncbi:MAG: ZIP family metal transporter [Deltaproteobacteria bacterium]|nr:ZIP family metal transporter [Deltaproteobacteria bacterium]